MTKKYTISLIIFISFFSLTHLNANSQNHMNAPWTLVNSSTSSIKISNENRQNFPILDYAFYIYHHYISPIDGENRCSFYPSCSRYSEDAFKKHGIVIGALLTFDRLQRCGFESNPKIIFNTRIVIYDPLSNNDFWFLTGKK